MHSLARSIALGLLLAASATQAAPWTYRGTLNDGGEPANGRYDIRLSLLDAGGAKSLAYPLTFSGVEVKSGVFAIDVDFGMDLAQFGALKLKTEVAQGDSGFVALGVPKDFDAKAALGGVCWDTTGNSGNVTGTNFVGNVDAVPLDLRSSNVRVARFWKPAAQVTNIVLGSNTNAVLDAAFGATIGGGGQDGSGGSEIPNIVSDDYGTVSGGIGNHAGDKNGSAGNASYATVSGGVLNNSSGRGSVVGGGYGNAARMTDLGYSTVAGGANNDAAGDYSMVPGGNNNDAQGDYSFAAGRRALVRGPIDTGESVASCGSNDTCGDEGTFVWGDSQNASFTSTGANQFLVRANGGVAINTTRLGNHPNLRSAELTVRSSDVNADLNLMTANARGYSMAVVPDGAAGAGSFYVQELNAISTGEPTWTPRLIITPGGQTQVQGGAVGTISDARLKKNIDGIAHPLDTFLALRGHRFEYTDPARALGATGTRMGFVAQEVKNVLPQWVSENGEGYYSVAPSGFEALAVEAVREQQQHINALQSENRALHDVVRGLSERLAALEAAKEH